MTGEAVPASTPAMWLWRGLIIVGWALILAGLALCAWEGLMWLRDGYWSRDSLADLWGRSPLGGAAARPEWQDMRGLHMILEQVLRWLGRCPISLAAIALGLATAWTANGLHDGAERAATRRGAARRPPALTPDPGPPP